MKNHDEFRRTVFEKARLYEAKRKARNKKIIETVSLCSLCLVIGISAYFVFGRDLYAPEAVETMITTPFFSEKPSPIETTENSVADMTTTGAYMTTTATQTTQTTIATTVVSTTVEMTFSTTTCTPTFATTTEATHSETTDESTSIQPSPSTVSDLKDLASYPHHHENGNAFIKVYEDQKTLQYDINTLYRNCADIDMELFTETFFEDYVLIITHVPDSYIWHVETENGNIIRFPDGTNPHNDDVGLYQLLIEYMDKDKFVSATLIIETP